MADAAPSDGRSREQAKQWKKERKVQAQRKAQGAVPAPAGQPAESKHVGKGRPQDPSVQLSKTLAYILRHGAEKEQLTMRSDGYIRVDAVLRRPRVQKVAMDASGRAPSLADVQAIVDTSEKKRYELAQGSEAAPNEPGECWWVRAVQGHSLENVTELSHTPLDASNVGEHLETHGGACLAIHGTDEAAWDAIHASGALKRMGRNHVHLAKGLPGASGVISGA
jgi:hypothetical protein